MDPRPHSTIFLRHQPTSVHLSQAPHRHCIRQTTPGRMGTVAQVILASTEIETVLLGIRSPVVMMETSTTSRTPLSRQLAGGFNPPDPSTQLPVDVVTSRPRVPTTTSHRPLHRELAHRQLRSHHWWEPLESDLNLPNTSNSHLRPISCLSRPRHLIAVVSRRPLRRSESRPSRPPSVTGRIKPKSTIPSTDG